ncbi:MAG TPA: radical SAM protein [Pyrinomonadaceae bacterium]
MLIRPHTLSLITTHKCTAACDHCCFDCTPQITKSIPIPRLFTLIDEATNIESIRVVVFTGGECFLLGDKLDELIRHATSHGFITRCVTNGYWATSESAASRRVERLVKAGLKEINLSTGTFHAQYVPVERIINAACACGEANITTLINAEIFKETSFRIEDLTEHPKLSEMIKSHKVKLQRNVWMQNNGLVQITHAKEHTRFNEQNKTGCTTAMNVIAITPDQHLVACCGLTMEQIPDLHLGSVATHSIEYILNNTPDDFLKIWIHIEGPERILEFVKSHLPSYRLPVEFVHPCQTCSHLYNDEQAKDVLRKNYREVESKITQLYLAGLAGHLMDQRIKSLHRSAAD